MNPAAKSSDASSTQLHGRWLLIGRAAWLAMTALTLIVFIASLPVYFMQIQTVCYAASCPTWQFTPAGVRAIEQLGFSLRGQAILQVTLAALIELVSLAVAMVIFLRRSDELIALVVALFLVGFVSDINNNLEALGMVQPAWNLPIHVLNYVGWIITPFWFYLFPDGRFVPRWTRWVAIASAILYLPSAFFPGSILDIKVHLVTLSTLLFIGLWFSFIRVQIYRYVRVSTPPQRQQTKWVVFGGSVALLGLVLLGSSNQVTNQPQNIFQLMAGLMAYLLFLLIPLSIGVAILQFRLWDIDILIRRTLIYTTLTVTLGLFYFGSVLLLQLAFRSLSGDTSSIAIVISTLAIAALFAPLRKRLQDFIDRGFYRRKYDAGRALETFSAAARDEVELSKLADQLLGVVCNTMQPLSIFLWLKPTRPNKLNGEDNRQKM